MHVITTASLRDIYALYEHIVCGQQNLTNKATGIILGSILYIN